MSSCCRQKTPMFKHGRHFSNRQKQVGFNKSKYTPSSNFFLKSFCTNRNQKDCSIILSFYQRFYRRNKKFFAKGLWCSNIGETPLLNLTKWDKLEHFCKSTTLGEVWISGTIFRLTYREFIVINSSAFWFNWTGATFFLTVLVTPS